MTQVQQNSAQYGFNAIIIQQNTSAHYPKHSEQISGYFNNIFKHILTRRYILVTQMGREGGCLSATQFPPLTSATLLKDLFTILLYYKRTIKTDGFKKNTSHISLTVPWSFYFCPPHLWLVYNVLVLFYFLVILCEATSSSHVSYLG